MEKEEFQIEREAERKRTSYLVRVKTEICYRGIGHCYRLSHLGLGMNAHTERGIQPEVLCGWAAGIE